jgi:hypothetical protein
MRPFAVATVLASLWRLGLLRIAIQPPLHFVVIELLRPEESCERLAGGIPRIGRQRAGDHGREVFVRFPLPPPENLLELGSERALRRLGVVQTKTHRHALFRIEAQRVPCRAFCAALLRVHGGRVAVDDEPMKGVLRVGGPGVPEQPFGVGLVVGEEQRRVAVAVQPTPPVDGLT